VSLKEVVIDEHRPPGTLVKVVDWGDDDIGLFIKTFRISTVNCRGTRDWLELDKLEYEHKTTCGCSYPRWWHHKVLIKGTIHLFNTLSFVLVNAG